VAFGGRWLRFGDPARPHPVREPGERRAAGALR
jgi:hypothetical protein